MKKSTLINVCALIFLATIFTSCMTVRVAAPYQKDGSKVVLATNAENLAFKESNKNWYFLWGSVPISHNATDAKIESNGLKKVRITTKSTFFDYVISLITSPVSIVCNTTIIEGSND